MNFFDSSPCAQRLSVGDLNRAVERPIQKDDPVFTDPSDRGSGTKAFLFGPSFHFPLSRSEGFFFSPWSKSVGQARHTLSLLGCVLKHVALKIGPVSGLYDDCWAGARWTLSWALESSDFESVRRSKSWLVGVKDRAVQSKGGL